MRIVEDKLERFESEIMADVIAQKNEIVGTAVKANDEVFDRKETEFLTEAYNIIQSGLKKIDKERHEIISKAIMENKTKLLQKRGDVVESVFSLAVGKLKAFTKTTEYKNYLIQLIKQDLTDIGSGKVEIYINHTDEGLLSELNAKFNGTVKLENKNTDMIGGCKILNTEKGFFIDDSFLKRLSGQRDTFMQTCKIPIE